MTLGNRISRNPDLEVVRTPTHGQHEVRLNLAMAPVSNKAFRTALQHVTDRKSVGHHLRARAWHRRARPITRR